MINNRFLVSIWQNKFQRLQFLQLPVQVRWVGAEAGEAEELVAGEVDQLGGMQTQFQTEKAMKDKVRLEKARGEKATKEKAKEARNATPHLAKEPV